LTADIHEPLEQYAAHFKTAHIKNTYDFLKTLYGGLALIKVQTPGLFSNCGS